MDERAKELVRQGDHLFEKRRPLLSLWQEIADHFYPERADFTVSRSLGTEFAAHLNTSYPILARRDLGNSLASILRPSDKEWFKVGVSRPDRVDTLGRRWMEWATTIQRRAMFDRHSGFHRATSEADHDFATFGNPVISVGLNTAADRLMFRCWHIRDVVWTEGPDGQIDTVHRKWKASASDLVKMFKGNVDPRVKEKAEKEPYCEFEVRHIVVPGERYAPPQGKKQWPTPFVSIFIDVANQKIMEEAPSWTLKYVIPRWQTAYGSQYAISPATVAALPDARLIQDMTRVLLEAGEKAVDPPVIGVQEAIRSDVNLFAGGFTAVDADYDERLGEVLRPLALDKSGIPLGLDMQKDVRFMISEAFFLSKLNMPPIQDRNMTAYETGQRIQENIRQLMPLFGPMESDYNGQLCEMTFETMLRAGGFGSVVDIPQSLRGQDIQFQFETMLHDVVERAKGQRFIELSQLLSVAAQIDPTATTNVDIQAAFRDTMPSVGVPSKWIVPEDQAAEARQNLAQRQQVQALTQQMAQGADIAKTMGEAGQAMNSAAA